jgi:HAD superfamily hydrolase (TIGR01509 family)
MMQRAVGSGGSMTPACIVLDAMGVMFAAADDVEELLIPFVASVNATADARQIRSAYLDSSLGAIGADEFWTRVGLSPAVEDDYLTRHTLVHGAIPFLQTAKDVGVPVWCLSNDVARWSAKLRAKFGLDRLLSGAVISSDVRSRKPDAAIYRHLLDACGEAPADIVFVDDRQHNVEAARALGIASIEFDAGTGFHGLAARIFGVRDGHTTDTG